MCVGWKSGEETEVRFEGSGKREREGRGRCAQYRTTLFERQADLKLTATLLSPSRCSAPINHTLQTTRFYYPPATYSTSLPTHLPAQQQRNPHHSNAARV